MESLFNLFSTKQSSKQESIYRYINLNKNNNNYPSNEISTTQYSLISFFPQNLYKQFCISANIYFLVIGILQTIHAISNSHGKPLIFIPLFAVIFVSMIKDFIEDLKRRISDRKENNQKILIRDQQKFQIQPFKNIRVGDFVKIEKNQQIPCDLIILYSSDQKGLCYLETKNLDGETSLKRKQVQKDLRNIFTDENKIYNTQSILEFCNPSMYLDDFHAVFKIGGLENTLNSNSLLLRGCSLQNTEYIIGLACYTGKETKIMLNSIPGRKKHSKVETLLYQQIIYVSIIQQIICFFCSIINTIMSYDEVLQDFLGIEFEFHYQGFLTIYGTWILLLTNLIPISLIVSVESIKLIQGFLMEKDFQRNNKQNLQVNSSNLNESLGQVQCIFTDKTGTLTQNKMLFKNICINGQSYGQDKQEQEEYLDQSHITTNKQPDIKNYSQTESINNKNISQYVDFQDDQFQQFLSEQNYIDTMICICICNQIFSEQQFNNEIKYSGTSPDEIALVYFAQYCGFVLMPEQQNGIIIIHNKIEDVHYEFKLLHILEFTSNRQRMSVIVQNLQNNNIEIYIKGADNIILEKLDLDINNQLIINLTQKQLDKYGVAGLRTLVLAKKSLTEIQFNEWDIKYKNSKNLQCIIQIKKENRETQMEIYQNLIENNFKLLGATAIEDKLQENVEQVINQLRNVGIKFWILTGDKLETAINIALSTNLFQQNDEIYKIFQKNNFDLDLALTNIQESVKSNRNKQKQLVITGDALRLMTENQNTMDRLMKLSEQFEAVLVCRVSPRQKQEIVKKYKDFYKDITTLAIGDGANDVNMITEAHIGIGIKGVEGSQASRASDYSITQFKYLLPLLLFYGREFYRKNTDVIFYNFYKNFLMVLSLFWFGSISNFSGVFIFDIWIFQCFNIFFASFPIMLYGIYDVQFSKKFCILNPQLYKQGMNDNLYNNKRFIINFLNSLMHSGIIVFFSMNCLNDNFLQPYGGQSSDLNDTGMFIFSSVVVLSNLKIITYSHNLNFFQILIFVFSMVSYFCIFYLFSQIETKLIFNCLQFQIKCPMYVLTLFLITLFTFQIDLLDTKDVYLKIYKKIQHTRINKDEEFQTLRSKY